MFGPIEGEGAPHFDAGDPAALPRVGFPPTR